MYNSFYGNNPRGISHRPIPIVRPVNRSQEQLKEFRDFLSNPRISCSMCGDIATPIASYDMIDATLVEKYCDTCLARGIN